jgi:lysine 2,3-aminomutase
VQSKESIEPSEWRSWRWQLRHRIRTVAELEPVVRLTAEERRGCADASFALSITPYYLSLLDPEDPRCPVRRQAIPVADESLVHAGECPDPLAEERHMPVPGLTHRYPDRVLIYATHHCAMHCRHCNRRRKVGDPHSAPRLRDLQAACAYVAGHPEVHDVLVSGGDPLTLSEQRLDRLLTALLAVPHVDIVRLATRVPVTLPQRVTPELVAMLRHHRPLYLNTHFNHPKECTAEAAAALAALCDAGCVLCNQMVLLRGINDDLDTVRQLNRWLLKQRCRPYYIFQADPVEGTKHFRTPLATGTALIDGLRGWTSGLGVPHFVVDLPGGGGKVPLQPDYLVRREEGRVVFRNYAGGTFAYDE